MKIATIISGDERRIRGYLGKFSYNETEKRSYITCEEIGTQLLSLLDEKGFKVSTHPIIDKAYRENFIKEYIDTIGLINKKNNTRPWWATDIASRSRFTSRLTNIFQQYLKVMDTVEREDRDMRLLIINPPWTMVPSLKAMFKNKNIPVVCIGIFRNKWRNILPGLYRHFTILARDVFKIAWRVFYTHKKLSSKITEETRSKDPYYVIKTFIYNHSFKKDSSYEDVFFGNLPAFLRDKKRVLIYACILGDYKDCIQKIKRCKGYSIIPLEYLLSIGDILIAAWEMVFSRVRVKDEALFFGHNVRDIVNRELSRTHNGIQFYQYLHYWATRSLLKKVTVETFLMTYENSPWERMCTMALRELSPSAKIVGYQHAVIPQSSTNVFISRYEEKASPLPDIILTVGDAPKEIIERYSTCEAGRMAASCGFRYQYLLDAQATPKDGSNNILVALEGIPEVYKMVNYVLRELGNDKSYHIKIRTHPILPVERLKYRLTHDLDSFSNVTVSDDVSLAADIEEADIVIYWGTTVALEALSMAKPVIHFDMATVLSYDPLFEFGDLKWTVTEKDSLKPLLREIASMTSDELNVRRAKAKQYLSSYFFPVTKEALTKFV